MTDSEIIRLLTNRSENALVELHKKYGKYCNKIAINILNNHEDSEECLNDAYLQVWNSIPPNNPKSLLGYLGKITRNVSLDKYRAKSAKKRGGTEIEYILDELKLCIPSNNSVEKEYESIELRNQINSFLHSIEPQKRTIFVMRYYYAYNIKIISKKLRLNENTVKSILYRTRLKLKEYFQEEGISL
ncbi:MAG: sigma-70 family RNA polymerase sigma factor [Vallitalea sp.]|nr:sigma-70 family RNA polymerase sigma factor [Vallitalea sp.]